MNLFFSRSIIILLFMLQGLSPLVHAHVQADNGETGLHIEGINVLAEKNVQFISPENIGHSDTIIGMRSAIQQKNLRLISDLPDNGYSGDYTQHLAKSHFIKSQSPFSPPVFHKKLSLSLSAIAPRAPPANISI